MGDTRCMTAYDATAAVARRDCAAAGTYRIDLRFTPCGIATYYVKADSKARASAIASLLASRDGKIVARIDSRLVYADYGQIPASARVYTVADVAA
jgi:hypothetical protein